MGCCESVRYDSKGCCSNNMLFLMLVFGDGFSFLVLRKRSRNKIVKINIYHMSQVIPKDRWGICSHFSMGCCKMIQKVAVQTTFCFWCWFLVMGFLFVILGKDQQTKLWRSTFTTCHMTFKKMGGRICSHFSMGCCKSVHCDSKGCCSNNIVFLMFLLHYSKVISYNVLSKFSDVSSRSVQKKHLS